MKVKDKLTEDEWNLRYGTEPVGPLLQRLGISTPANNAELEKFNTFMEQMFGLSRIQDKFVPVRYLLACEALGIKSITLIGFKALLPERPGSVPSAMMRS